MRNDPSSEERARLGAIGVATGLGCSIVVSLIVLIGGGVALDQLAETSPVFTLIGVLLGLVAAGYQLYELTRVGLSNRSAGPLGRQLERLPGGRRASAPSSADREE